MATNLSERLIELTDHIAVALAVAEAITIGLPEPVPAELLAAITTSPDSRRNAAVRAAREAGLQAIEQFHGACAGVSNQVDFNLLEKTQQLFRQLKRLSGLARMRLADKTSGKQIIEDQIGQAVKAAEPRRRSRHTKGQELVTA